MIVFGSVAASAQALCVLVMVIRMGKAIDDLGRSNEYKDKLHEVSEVRIIFCFIGGISGMMAFSQCYCWTVIGEKLAARMPELYLKAVFGHDIGACEKEANRKEIMETITGHTVLIQEAKGENVGKFIYMMLICIGCFTIGFFKECVLTIIMLLPVILLIVVNYIKCIRTSQLATQQRLASNKASAAVEPMVSSIRHVKSCNGEKHVVEDYKNELKKSVAPAVKIAFATGLLKGLNTLFISCSCGFGILYAAGRVPSEVAVTVLFAIFVGSMSLGHALSYLSVFTTGLDATNKMLETVNKKPLIDPHDTNIRNPDSINGDIEFKDVCFTHPAGPNEMKLDQISIFISQGKFTAFVGEIGCVKSAIISLIQRFYDPQEGAVLIDGINLKELEPRWIRKNIGLLCHEPVLFAGSIKDNIILGKDGTSDDDDIHNALVIANAADFVSELPQGIDTMVGAELTWDQRQRLVIAREVLRNPRILLLDEVTGVLTGESERIVQEALDKLMVNRTTVVLTCRLNTIKNADMIALVHQGRIVEQGSHSDLEKVREGRYCQLIKQQETHAERVHHQTANVQEIIHTDSERQHSQIVSVTRTSSSGSSGIGSSLNSFSFASEVSIRMVGSESDISAEIISPDVALPKPEVPFLLKAYHIYKPVTFYLLIGATFALISGGTNSVFGWVLSSAIYTFYDPAKKTTDDAGFWAGILCSLGVLSLLMQSGFSYFLSEGGCELENRTKYIMAENVTNMGIPWFDKSENSSTAITARLSKDPARLRSLMEDDLPSLSQNIASVLVALISAFIVSWLLALILLLLCPFAICNWNIPFVGRCKFRREGKKQLEEAGQIASETVEKMRTVVSLGAEKKFLELYRSKCEGSMKCRIRDGIIGAIGLGLSFTILFAFYAVTFDLGVRLRTSNKTSPKGIFEVFNALTMATIALARTGNYVFDYTEVKASVESVFADLEREPKIDTEDESGTTIDNVKGEIEFRSVSFKYPLRPAIQIFRDLNLIIQPGKVVALVGESGSGKSTLIAMLQRFYDPNSGVILLDGIEIKTLQLPWLRQKMGLVSKEPVLFNDTIRANIVYGMSRIVTETEIQAAAELANAHNFISSLPQGYDTMVGDGGMELTRSQKQRVAIARVIIKAPKFLLLDEDPVTLDDESEGLVQDALICIMNNRTTIVVAHRRCTMESADVIVKIKNGGIVIEEKEKHETLINIEDDIYASPMAYPPPFPPPPRPAPPP